MVISDYRLYPEVKFPTFVHDGAQAIAWVTENIGKYGGLNKNIHLMGHSAGAHIAPTTIVKPSNGTPLLAGCRTTLKWAKFSGRVEDKQSLHLGSAIGHGNIRRTGGEEIINVWIVWRSQKVLAAAQVLFDIAGRVFA